MEYRGERKWAARCARLVPRAVRQLRGREAQLWLDKVCIDQSNIGEDLGSSPVIPSNFLELSRTFSHFL